MTRKKKVPDTFESDWEGVITDTCEDCDSYETRAADASVVVQKPFDYVLVNFLSKNNETTEDFGLVKMDDVTTMKGTQGRAVLKPLKVISTIWISG